MDEVKTEIETYTLESNEKINSLIAEKETLETELNDAKSKHENDIVKYENEAITMSEEFENTKNALDAERSKFNRKVDDSSNKDIILNSKIENIKNDNVNLKVIIEKKNTYIDEMKNETEETIKDLTLKSEEAHEQVKSKTSELQKSKAK